MIEIVLMFSDNMFSFVGQIQNRFSKDVRQLDESLPKTFFEFLQVNYYLSILLIDIETNNQQKSWQIVRFGISFNMEWLLTVSIMNSNNRVNVNVSNPRAQDTIEGSNNYVII